MSEEVKDIEKGEKGIVSGEKQPSEDSNKEVELEGAVGVALGEVVEHPVSVRESASSTIVYHDASNILQDELSTEVEKGEKDIVVTGEKQPSDDSNEETAELEGAVGGFVEQPVKARESVSGTTVYHDATDFLPEDVSTDVENGKEKPIVTEETQASSDFNKEVELEGAVGGVEQPLSARASASGTTVYHDATDKLHGSLGLGDDDFKDLALAYDPMKLHHEMNVPIDDFSGAATGCAVEPFNEKDLKKIPCKHHDGYTGFCWKGKSCPYGHEKFTGGEFAKSDPELNFGVCLRSDVNVTSISFLAKKRRLNREAKLKGIVTHVVSPSEFYMKLIGQCGYKCPCHKVEDWIKHFNKLEGEAMDDYYYGFSGIEAPAGMAPSVDPRGPKLEDPEVTTQKLNRALTELWGYKRYQSSVYIPNAELVAVCKDEKWKRALVTAEFPETVEDNLGLRYRVQLLDTGEKLTVSANDMCRLPERYCRNSPPAAYRCALFGISPAWCVWTKEATQHFKDLVLDKEVTFVIKQSVSATRDGTFAVFEKRPYVVKIVTQFGDEFIDVRSSLLDAGYGLEWHPFPFRPFASTVISTRQFDFLYYPTMYKLPEFYLELENSRLAWHRHVEVGKSYWPSDDEEEVVCRHRQSTTASSEKWRKKFRLGQIAKMIADYEKFKKLGLLTPDEDTDEEKKGVKKRSKSV